MSTAACEEKSDVQVGSSSSAAPATRKRLSSSDATADSGLPVSSQRESRSTRDGKRARNGTQPEYEEDDEEEIADTAGDRTTGSSTNQEFPNALLFQGNTSILRSNYKERAHIIRVSDSVQMKFDLEMSKSATETNQAVKALQRLIIFKGGRKEIITKSTVNDFLKRLDPKFTKCANAILRRVQIQLEEGNTGYVLLSTADIVGAEGGKKDEFILCNGLLSDKLQQAIACGLNGVEGQSATRYTFMLFVFFAILAAGGQRISLADLCEQMHNLDNRFPPSVSTSTKVSAVNTEAFAIPELNDDFRGLINRMKREHYLIQLKEDGVTGGAAADPSTIIYSFGSRFYLEVGRKRLVNAYYALVGQPADEAMIKEIDEEYENAMQEDADEDGSEEEGEEA